MSAAHASSRGPSEGHARDDRPSADDQVIERLTSTIRALCALGADEIGAPNAARLRDDCADALRLELDCPQQSLTPAERKALSALSDALEAASPPDILGDAARRAGSAIGVVESARPVERRRTS